ncbi:hypothetical protein BS627_19485, partial [Agrobacterium salinitolerans]
RPQQNVIIPKKKKPAENIDGFVSGLNRQEQSCRFLFARKMPTGVRDPAGVDPEARRSASDRKPSPAD